MVAQNIVGGEQRMFGVDADTKPHRDGEPPPRDARLGDVQRAEAETQRACGKGSVTSERGTGCAG